MENVQLGLIDLETGEMLFAPIEEYVEDDVGFMQMTEIAKNYGAELGRLYATNRITDQSIDNRIIGFVDGMSANRALSAEEREWLRNDVLSSAIKAANGRLWSAVDSRFGI